MLFMCYFILTLDTSALFRPVARGGVLEVLKIPLISKSAQISWQMFIPFFNYPL